jgi:hypothetical protein
VGGIAAIVAVQTPMARIELAVVFMFRLRKVRVQAVARHSR